MKNLVVIFLSTMLFSCVPAPKKVSNNISNNSKPFSSKESINSASAGSSNNLLKGHDLYLDCKKEKCLNKDEVAIYNSVAKEEKALPSENAWAPRSVELDHSVIRSHKDWMRDINNRHNQIHNAVLKAEKKRAKQ